MAENAREGIQMKFSPDIALGIASFRLNRPIPLDIQNAIERLISYGLVFAQPTRQASLDAYCAKWGIATEDALAFLADFALDRDPDPHGSH